MAITFNPKFHRPVRNRPPNRVKSGDESQVDIGWAEGLLSDGRPFSAELWAEDQVTCITIFIDIAGLENANADALNALLETEKLVHWKSAKHHLSAMRFCDDTGRNLWSLNLAVGNEDEVYLDRHASLKFFRYP